MIKHIGKDEFQPKIRYINGLTIYFATKETIYVTDNKVAIVLERWFEGKNNYKEKWSKVCRILKLNKGIRTPYEVWNIAMSYDVSRHQTFRFPEIKQGTITIKEKDGKKED